VQGGVVERPAGRQRVSGWPLTAGGRRSRELERLPGSSTRGGGGRLLLEKDSVGGGVLGGLLAGVEAIGKQEARDQACDGVRDPAQ